MSLVAAFTLIVLCGIVILSAVLARQTGDPVNRYGIGAGVAVLLLEGAVIAGTPSGETGWVYNHPAEIVLALALFAVLMALGLRLHRTRRMGQIIDPSPDGSNHLQGLLNSIPMEVAFVTPDWRYGFVNDAYCQAIGLHRSDIIGQHPSQIIGADVFPQIKDNLDKAFSGEQVTWLFNGTRPLLQRTEGSAVYQPLMDREQVVGVLVIVMDRSSLQDAAQQAEFSEAKHALAAEVAGVGYLEWDSAGALVDVSPEVEELLGRDARTLSEMWQQGQRFVDPRSRATLSYNLQRAGRQPRDVIETLKFLTENGRQIELRSSMRRVEGRGGVRLLAAIQDVTEQQRVLNELVESETRFRDFAASATDWVWEMDVNRRFTFLSGGGRQTDEGAPFFHLGSTFAEANVARDLGDYDLLQQRLATQAPFRDLRLVIPQPGGNSRKIDMSGKPFFDSSGALAGYRGTCFDMTEIAAARSERQGALEALALAFENISTMVALFDAEDRLVYCNDKYRASFLGLNGGDIIGWHFDELLEHFVNTGQLKASGDKRSRWMQRRRNRRAEPAQFLREESWDGRWLEVTDYLLAAGGLLTIAADITERVSGEERLHHHENALQLLNRRETLGQMTAAIAHELNQPLSAIHNFAAGCVLRAKNNQLERDDMIAVLSSMQSQSERASAILRSMSNYLHSDPADYVTVPFDELLRSVRLLIQPESAATGVAVVIEDGCDGTPLHCARIEIEQLLINLIKNGIEACRESGRSDAEVKVTAWCDEDDIVVDVCDGGMGFAQDMPIEKAFTAFRSTKAKGLGVGLAICETIAESHGGSIQVTKSNETGACLTVRLPLVVQE
ncbi:PAS domain-containing protein [Sulfitobacter sp. S0837]|uniref:PAS domain-containing sensor histidine kinase n=1 Tax=Sulfitobacter maritimus TaxID=2741719 RepID=UPI001581E2F9|nr:PAS domain-containing protein [Sulfitobacter maritimus]NUH65697.1 PAS domain-containing protein [Sulfitobacter maritimus]